MRRSALVLIVLGLVGFVATATRAARAQPPIAQATVGIVDLVEVRGLIDAPVANYLLERLEKAGAAAADTEGADALILQIDSPGALDVDVDVLVAAVEDAAVPIVAWVAPRGARVAGAATDLVRAADLLFVGTDAHAPDADGSAAALQDVLRALDGRNLDGTTLETWDGSQQLLTVSVRFQDMTVLAQVLHSVTSPEVALMLLLIGIFGLIFEAYNPGIGLAAIIGLASLVLALYALDALPTNWWGILAIVAGIAALVYDVHVAGLGPATLAGLAGIALGARLLFPTEPDAVSLSWWAIGAALVGTLVFFISVMTAALRVRLRRPISDEDALIGTIGEAQTDIAPEGTVLTKGTVWRARTMETGIAAGEKVKVMASEGFVLLVEPVHHDD